MPLKEYDRYFGGKGGAAKAHSAMIEKYGTERGERIFYSTKNKKKTLLSRREK